MIKAYKKNWLLISCVLALSLFGILMIYSASFYSAEINFNDSFHFVKKQIIGLVIGIGAFIFASLFNYRKYDKYKWIIIIISIVFLALVFVPFIGVENNGARRWIGFGSFTIQSSEIAKFGFVIFAACYMNKNYKKLKTLLGILPVILAGGIICMLILLEPNLSITLCVGLVLIVMLVVGGIKLKHFLMLAIPALALLPLLIIMEPYRLDRLVAFLDPWSSPREEGFQLIQSLYALGSGGMFGVGLFNSRQKFLFLPFSESDFIFSIIGEEFGFIGATLLIIVYLIIIIQGIKIAIKAKDRLGSYLAFGVTSVITMQVLINVAVVTGSIPPTGIPLPFISAGGSSLIVFLAAVGILVNISGNGVTSEEYILLKNVNFNIFKRKSLIKVKKKTIQN